MGYKYTLVVGSEVFGMWYKWVVSPLLVHTRCSQAVGSGIDGNRLLPQLLLTPNKLS